MADTLALLTRVKDILFGMLEVIIAAKRVLEEVKGMLLIAKDIAIITGELLAAAGGLFYWGRWAQWVQEAARSWLQWTQAVEHSWLQWDQWAESIRYKWIYECLLILFIFQWRLVIKVKIQLIKTKKIKSGNPIRPVVVMVLPLISLDFGAT